MKTIATGIVCLFFCLFGSVTLWGQSKTDTVHQLSTVNIEANAIRSSPTGSTTEHWSEDELNSSATQSVADLLNLKTNSFIKSYGMGSLATSSIRGGSAGHTLVLWNGVPIQNPMLGQLDLSLLPLHAMESVSFTKGGNSSLWGSGAIGGVINLENQSDYSPEPSISLRGTRGSFGQREHQIKASYGGKRVRATTRFAHRDAENNFFYFQAEGLPEREQTNAEFFQRYVLQDIYWKINPSSEISVHYWGQESDRNLPPTLVQNKSEAHQDDRSSRALLQFKHLTNKGFLQAKLALLNEDLNYYDDLIRLESKSHFRTYLGEITNNWYFGNHHVLVGLTHIANEANSKGYRDNEPSQNRTALFGSWKYARNKWVSQVSMRQELVDSTLTAFTPSIGLEYSPIKQLSLKGKVSRNFNLPTFNDRFWQPGGNPDLLPESGWSQEVGVAYEATTGPLSISTSLTAFNRNIHNWILWSQKEGQRFWSANNITEVWSRGLEPRLELTYRQKDFSFSLFGGYDFIKSTNMTDVKAPVMKKGEQLIYTPEDQASGSATLSWKNLTLSYHHQYRGMARGMNEDVESYDLGNARIQYKGKIKSFSTTLFFNLNNVWDEDYLVLERRPMPGINWQTGIQINFN